MKHTRVVVLAALVMLAVLWAVSPLFGKKYIPTHDGEYHIIRIVEFSKMLAGGYLIPRWAPDMNSGYGIPIFNYHYPLPNYIGSLTRVFTRDAVLAFQMSMGLGYIALAAASFFWLFTLFGAVPAAVGAVVSAFVPYLFVDMYVRGSIGEVWATAFLFVCLYLLEKKKVVWFAVAYGLLILSHNILAMLYTPFLLGYALIGRKKEAIWMLGGLGISAFFWLPAVLESTYVVGLNTVNFREHFAVAHELLVPSWGTQFSGTGSFGNKISFQIGFVPILAMAGALYSSRKKILIYFLSFFAVCVLLMLPQSAPVWEFVRPLHLIQYPWRLLSLVIPVAGFSAALWVSSLKRPWMGVVLAVLAVVVASSYARPVLYAPRSESYYMSRSNFTDGTSSMGNSFSTIWTGWKDTRPAGKIAVTGGEMTAELRSKYLDKEFTVSMAQDGEIAVHTLYFPGWIAFVDGKPADIGYKKDGTIHVAVGQGVHRLRVQFTETPVRLGADLLSIVSFAILAYFGYTSIKRKNL